MRRNAVRKYKSPYRQQKSLPIKSSLGTQRTVKRERKVVKIPKTRRPSRLVPFLRGRLNQLSSGLGSMSAGVGRMSAGVGKMSAGVGKMSAGVGKAAASAAASSATAIPGVFATLGAALRRVFEVLLLAIAAPFKVLLYPFRFAAVRIALMIAVISLLSFKLYQEHLVNKPELAMELAYWPSESKEQPYIPELPLLKSSSIVHKVHRGDTLASIAMRYGFRSEEVAGLNEALRGSDPKDTQHQMLQPGQAVEMILGKEGFSGVRIPSNKAVTLVIERSKQGGFVSKLEKMEVQHRERVASGVITSSFAAAAQKTGVSYDVVDDLVDLFSDRVNFHQDFQVGDRFVIIYRDQVLESGESVGAGAILAAALYLGDKRLVATRYVGSDGKARYFDEKQQYLGNGILRYPLKFTRISSYFTQSRFHPVLKVRKPHNGVDFAAPVGTPVRSVANGKVLIAGMNGPNGIMIKIQHNDRYSTAYLHLSKLAPGIRRGATVTRGQVIGAVGTTGRSTGPHLHYSFYDRGKYLDPLKITLPTIDILDRGMRIDKTYLNRVLYTLEQYQSSDVNARSSAR